jgi:hypothetical protein
MREILFLLVILMIFSACKKDGPDPAPEIESIVGKWRLKALEKTEDGQKIWEEINIGAEPSYISFRFDGVLLDHKGLPFCCQPDSLTLNGNPFKIVPKAKLPDNPVCSVINCATCPNWEIQQNGNEITIASCLNFVGRKYEKE